MEIINAFNHKIYLFKDTSNYSNLLSNLDKIFDSAKIKFSPRIRIDRIGCIRSTVSLISKEDMLDLPQMEHLAQQVKKHICKLHNRTEDTLVFDRIWANRNFKNSGVKVHHHKSKLAGVCIFYLDAPDSETGKLVMINEGTDDKILLSDYPEENKFYISVKTGDIIIHSEKVYHGVSEYKSDNPRTAIIFDYYFK
jgi:hypothetical protein